MRADSKSAMFLDRMLDIVVFPLYLAISIWMLTVGSLYHFGKLVIENKRYQSK